MTLTQRDWRSFVEGIIVLLNELDPYGLDSGHLNRAPRDEFGHEALLVAGVLVNNGAISRGQLDEIWRDWFHEPISDVVGAQAAERFTPRLNLLVKSTPPAGPAC